MSLSSLNTENETNLKNRLPRHQQSASSLSHLSCFPGTVYYEVATHLLTHRTHCTPSPGGRLTTQLTCMHSFLSRLEHLLTQNSIFPIPQRSPCGRLSSLLMVSFEGLCQMLLTIAQPPIRWTHTQLYARFEKCSLSLMNKDSTANQWREEGLANTCCGATGWPHAKTKADPTSQHTSKLILCGLKT